MLKDYPDVLDVKQVAKILGIGINLAYKLINSKQIGSLRIGSKIIVPKICVSDYLNSARYHVAEQ